MEPNIVQYADLRKQYDYALELLKEREAEVSRLEAELKTASANALLRAAALARDTEIGAGEDQESEWARGYQAAVNHIADKIHTERATAIRAEKE